MLEEYYSRLVILNSNPELFKDKPIEAKAKLKDALDKVTDKIENFNNPG